MKQIDFSQFDKGIFLVNALAIIYNPKLKKILIGRRENDPYVPELSWSFPGGRPKYNKEIEESLKEEIKKKTNLDVKIKNLILARITPEIKRKQILLYYYCETKEENIKAGEKFSQVDWIYPKDYKSYFKTSIHPKIAEFLETLK